jgi:SAM-dependent methyltransferase
LDPTTARARIVAGDLRGSALLETLLAMPSHDREAWIDAVLGIAPPPPDRDLPRGAVPYLPAGVDEIIAMVREASVRATDELVDLGSGLGRVLVLAHLLSGAAAHGIELQPHLVEAARATCTELHLPAVTFTHGNAADLELDGSVFFLYAPFNGDMLARVVRRLEAVARRRRIIIATVDLELQDVPWLAARPSSRAALTLYTPRNPPDSPVSS